MSTDPNFSFATIPFTVTKTKMTMQVYSPAAGTDPTTHDIRERANTYDEVSVFFDVSRGNGGYAPLAADGTYYYDDLAFVA